MNKVGPNAYILDIPTDLGISSTFNVEDLVPYHSEPYAETQVLDHQSPQPVPPLPAVSVQKEEIEAILDDQIISTR